MFRYLAVLLLIVALPHMAAAESVSFGASLDQDGGHIGGSATSVNSPAAGRIHWSGNGITITTGFIASHFVQLEGTITRSNDPNLEGQAVTIYAMPATESILFMVGDLTYVGSGRVTVR
jgi:hypothetical protein